jgi:hypothetical protein
MIAAALMRRWWRRSGVVIWLIAKKPGYVRTVRELKISVGFIVLDGRFTIGLPLQVPVRAVVEIVFSVTLYDHLLPLSFLGRDLGGKIPNFLLIRSAFDAELATLQLYPPPLELLDLRILLQTLPYLVRNHGAPGTCDTCVADVRQHAEHRGL